MILGPLPETAWTMTFTPTNMSAQMSTFQLATWSEETSSLDFVAMPIGDVFSGSGGVRVNAYTCLDYCQTFTSCGACTGNSGECGWCGGEEGTCLSLEYKGL